MPRSGYNQIITEKRGKMSRPRTCLSRVRIWRSRVRIWQSRVRIGLLSRPQQILSITRWVATWDCTVVWAGLWEGSRHTKNTLNPQNVSGKKDVKSFNFWVSQLFHSYKNGTLPDRNTFWNFLSTSFIVWFLHSLQYIIHKLPSLMKT